MKFLCLLSSLLFLAFLPGDPQPQTKYPQNYFRSPIDFPLQISGSFGEVRKNHIHSGIDIRTEGITGKPVYAVADGYVSRIFISSGGFGKALYIAHPNGYTSVYGHLERFNSRIAAWIKAKQYQEESFEQDATPEQGKLPVKKGEIIAYSGNAGMSEGPHLHFEIRDTPTQEIIDPFLFGLPLKDDIPPKIYRIRIYPWSENSRVNDSGLPVTIPVAGGDGKFHLTANEPVKISGDVIFAIEAFDFINDSGVKNGTTLISLFVDTACVFSHKLDRFAFSETRYVNSLLDYPEVVRHDQRFQRSYVAPNNKLRIYAIVKNLGIVNFSGPGTHKVRYVVGDAFGNKSQLNFTVVSQPLPPDVRKKHAEPKGKFFLCGKANHFTAENLVFDLPPEALYEDLDFNFSSSPARKNSFSPVYHLQDDETPLHTFCDLSVRPQNLPSRLASKAIIVRVNGNKGVSSVGGTMENSMLKARIREFGSYTVMVDTTPPVIRTVNITTSKNVSRQHSLILKISDNLSGIKSYRSTMNGKWILMDFDAKSGLLVYEFDERIKKGNNEFRLVVKDAAGNESHYRALLVW